MPSAPWNKYTDWRDFTNKACRPWVDSDGDDRMAEGLISEVGLWYMAAALVMADNALREWEAGERAISPE